MKGLYDFLIFAAFASCTYGCSRSKSIGDEVRSMQERTVRLDMQGMECCANDTSLLHASPGKSMRWIVYADSMECSSCFLKQIKEWNVFVQGKNNGNEKVGCVVIVFPQKGEYDAIKEEIQMNCAHPVYIDTAGLFERKNPQIPHAPMFHTFLVDKNDKVVLVGNPLRNEHIRKLFEKRVKSHNGIIK